VSEVGTAAAWLLACILVWSATAKLRTREETRSTFSALGLPAPRALATAVPTAEAVAAVALIVAPPIGASSTVVLLAAFTTLLARHVRRGSTVACGCFGSAGGEPISTADLVRNALLMAAAVVALWGAPEVPSLPAALAVGAAAASGLMLHGLVRLKLTLGVVWRNTLPGEPAGA
jgi:uncharacterized membrane protein YphA (DoxX/SURF4 family)